VKEPKNTPKTLSSPGSYGTSRETPWCLVLTIWGDKYGSAHVNELVNSARRFSPDLSAVVLFTDRTRAGVDSCVKQAPFPAYFDRPDFFAGAYRAKLAMFSKASLPESMRCVFVDLDTVVVGDLGKVAALVTDPNLYFMLPPAGLGFGKCREFVDWIRPGIKYPTGNSSIVAFHSAANPNAAATFQKMHASGIDLDAEYMNIDDSFISWFARGRVDGIPTSLAVMFRREFMSRSVFLLRIRSRLTWVQKRREGLVAITLNGVNYKPENLLALEDNAPMDDSKGRKGFWNGTLIGPAQQKIIASCKRILAAESP
jgi:hypothetical protein